MLRAREAILQCAEQSVLYPLFGCAGKMKMRDIGKENDQPLLDIEVFLIWVVQFKRTL